MNQKLREIEFKFGLGDLVYLKTDPDQLPRILTKVLITPKDIIYITNINGIETEHYDFELTSKRDINTLYSN